LSNGLPAGGPLARVVPVSDWDDETTTRSKRGKAAWLFCWLGGAFGTVLAVLSGLDG